MGRGRSLIRAGRAARMGRGSSSSADPAAVRRVGDTFRTRDSRHVTAFDLAGVISLSYQMRSHIESGTSAQ
jgi:hypothetical protein